MCHRALLDAKFWAFLVRIDEDLGAKIQARGRVRCGAKSHRDCYPRKPRGGPGDLGEAYRRRVSFTCSICDKRHTLRRDNQGENTYCRIRECSPAR
jgi:hypothetical protein